MYFCYRMEYSLLLENFNYKDNMRNKLLVNRFRQLQQHLGTRTQVRFPTTYHQKLWLKISVLVSVMLVIQVRRCLLMILSCYESFGVYWQFFLTVHIFQLLLRYVLHLEN